MLGDQCVQGIDGLGGVEVKYQAVLVSRHRRQREDLRANGLLEVNHQAHHGGGKLARANPCNIRIAGLDLGYQFFERRVKGHASNVHRQSGRVGDKGVGGA